MERKNKILAASAAFCLSLGMAFVSVGCGAGSYEMTNFIINTATVDVEYNLGDAVDFSTLTMEATFSDDSKKSLTIADVQIFMDDVNITNTLNKITETAGKKTLKIVYNSGHGTAEKTLVITVVDDSLPPPPPAPILPTVTQFDEPAFLASYKSDIASATNDSTAEAFESLYFEADEDEYYKVGDDNVFKFAPKLTYMDMEAGGAIQTVDNFKADTKAWLLVDGEYQAMEKRAAEENVYKYYVGDNLYITENAVKNEYTFGTSAVGNVLKICVAPDAETYEYSEEGIEFAFEVVDGFNVYEARELAILDNSGRSAWDEIKAGTGDNVSLLGVNPNAVILHSDLKITADVIPQAFQYTLPDSYSVMYKVGTNGEAKKPEEFGLSRTFLFDKTNQNTFYSLYEHTIAKGEDFAIYGNYFEMDATNLPLVASFEAQGVEGRTWYDVDFSNVALMHIMGNTSTMAEADEGFAFYNLAVKGNAKADQILVDSTKTTGGKSDTLVYGGGVIFVKINGATAVLDNVRTYTFFIPFFPEEKATVNYNQTKCYDSFQNAIYAWNQVDVTITNSYFKRAGGPLILMTHEDPEKDTNGERIPHMTIDDNSVMEAYLTGTEVWFKIVNAGGIIEPIKGMNAFFTPMGMSYLNAEGKMNIVAAMFCDTSDAVQAVNNIAVQGTFQYKTAYIDRMNNSVFGATLKQCLATGAPVFNVGQAMVVCNPYDQTNPFTFIGCDATAFMAPQKAEGDTSKHQSYITLNQGGISVVLGYNEI